MHQRKAETTIPVKIPTKAPVIMTLNWLVLILKFDFDIGLFYTFDSFKSE